MGTLLSLISDPLIPIDRVAVEGSGLVRGTLLLGLLLKVRMQNDTDRTPGVESSVLEEVLEERPGDLVVSGTAGRRLRSKLKMASEASEAPSMAVGLCGCVLLGLCGCVLEASSPPMTA